MQKTSLPAASRRLPDAGLPAVARTSSRRAEAGVTLVEITVVLSVVAILAAAAAPVAKRTVDRSRQSRALTDAQGIRTAVLNFLTDMPGYTGFTINGAAAGTTVRMLVSDGDTPELGAGAGEWDDPVDNVGGLTDFMERHLVVNDPRGLGTSPYPTSGASTWRGAYLTGPVDPDPWGNRYASNVRWLKDTPRSNDVIVLSCGPNEAIDTQFTVNGIMPGDDDIIVVVRRDIGVSVP